MAKFSKANLIHMSLDYINNFLSVECFADHYGLTMDQAYSVIARGKILAMAGRDPILPRDHFTNNVDRVSRDRFPDMSENNRKYFCKRHNDRLLAEYSA